MISAPPETGAVDLRAGSVSDLEAIVAIMDSAFDPAFGEAWTRAQCAGILPLSGVNLTIAEDEMLRPLGFSLHRAISGEAELLLLAVKQSAQRRGVGQYLLNRFISDARAAGALNVHLEVRENNPALAMYRRAGFRAAGRRKNYYSGKDGRSFDALTFVKNLAVPNSDAL